ncbi:MAG: hypothetical protein JJU34_07370 [Lunatimonas sp.]|uniref:hypothetical protein n=1 Tax=Lunatimonas sp. TaxID=2060141 RepID=UPI00263A6123|nr:hypothetical protein [Lunatimonas sp.]MCC5937084.1 hypothetical protein [Lunatimonas sp.]
MIHFPPLSVRRCWYAFLLVLTFSLTDATAQDVPSAVIKSDDLHVNLYLPDATKGYYRGSRFDWSGVVSQLTYQGHTYFGQWFPRYDPYLHDAIIGPVEAFDPIGYEEAKAGEEFLKIGIGRIRKIDEEPYRFTAPFEITDHGKWRVKKTKNSVSFRQHLSKKNGYGYQYTKTVELAKGQPEMKLVHRLENTGKNPIKTRVYNHNFFMLDNKPIGPAYEVSFPFQPTLISNTRGMGTVTEISGNKVVFKEAIPPGESIYFVLGGYSEEASDYDITLTNRKSGYGVRITNDHPIVFLPFWGIHTTLCPEPYMDVHVMPGESQSWTTTYSFFSTHSSPQQP